MYIPALESMFSSVICERNGSLHRCVVRWVDYLVMILITSGLLLNSYRFLLESIINYIDLILSKSSMLTVEAHCTSPRRLHFSQSFGSFTFDTTMHYNVPEECQLSWCKNERKSRTPTRLLEHALHGLRFFGRWALAGAKRIGESAVTRPASKVFGWTRIGPGNPPMDRDRSVLTRSSSLGTERTILNIVASLLACSWVISRGAI